MAGDDDAPVTDGSSAREKKHADLNSETKAVIRKFVHKISHEGLHNLRIQYNELKSFTPVDFSHKASSDNPTKCRYKDIVCIDKTRVILKWPPGCTDDFIHANWVTSDLFDNKFICTQAPKDITIVDFWRLVWQEKVKQILMLCRCEEAGKEKCAQYWPNTVDEVKQLPVGITIRCTKIDRSDENFIHTRLLVTYDKEKRFVDHRQWTTWPDKSVPQTPLSPFRLLQFTRKHVKYPSLIHCSAGVGRTGTMVAIEMIYKSLINGVQPDPPNLLKQLRSQRFLAVQTEDQYIYCHYSVIQLAFAKNWCSRHDVKMFCKEYKEYAKMVTENGCRPPLLNATRPPPDCVPCRKLEQRKKDKEQNDEVSEMSTRKRKNQGKGTVRKKLKKKRESTTPDTKPNVELLEGKHAETYKHSTYTPTAIIAPRVETIRRFNGGELPAISIQATAVPPKHIQSTLVQETMKKKDPQPPSIVPPPSPISPSLDIGIPSAPKGGGGASAGVSGGGLGGGGLGGALGGGFGGGVGGGSGGAVLPDNALAGGQQLQQPPSLRGTQMIQLLPGQEAGFGGGFGGGAMFGGGVGGGFPPYPGMPGQNKMGFVPNAADPRPGINPKPAAFPPSPMGQPQPPPSPARSPWQSPPGGVGGGNFPAPTSPAPQTMFGSPSPIQPPQPRPPPGLGGAPK